jgi:hypothetical protein
VWWAASDRSVAVASRGMVTCVRREAKSCKRAKGTRPSQHHAPSRGARWGGRHMQADHAAGFLLSGGEGRCCPGRLCGRVGVGAVSYRRGGGTGCRRGAPPALAASKLRHVGTARLGATHADLCVARHAAAGNGVTCLHEESEERLDAVEDAEDHRQQHWRPAGSWDRLADPDDKVARRLIRMSAAVAFLVLAAGLCDHRPMSCAAVQAVIHDRQDGKSPLPHAYAMAMRARSSLKLIVISYYKNLYTGSHIVL